MPIRKIQKYGWKKDSLDHRDQFLTVPHDHATQVFPTSFDLRTTGNLPPVYNQGQLGSCTANSVAAIFDYTHHKQGEGFMTPSRLMIYYDERVIEGTVSEDSGAEIRDGIKSVYSTGVCPESEWPYIESKFAVKPTAQCYTDAIKFESLSYAHVPQTEFYIKNALVTDVLPISFGFTVFEAFESDEVAETGIVPMPSASDSPIGGHAVVIVGYDDSKNAFLVRNSWGTGWGIDGSGYFWLPYNYVLDSSLSSDFWVITKVK